MFPNSYFPKNFWTGSFWPPASGGPPPGYLYAALTGTSSLTATMSAQAAIAATVGGVGDLAGTWQASAFIAALAAGNGSLTGYLTAPGAEVFGLGGGSLMLDFPVVSLVEQYDLKRRTN
jgi:hypothetical protein